MKPFRPMRAATLKVEDLDKLDYPMIGSPKLDGIRVVIHPELGPVTRTLKPVRNNYIQERLSDPFLFSLDGEIIIGNHESPEYSFQTTTSAVMSIEGEPDFTFKVFDWCGEPEKDYLTRLVEAGVRVRQFGCRWLERLEYTLIMNTKELLEYEADCLSRNYEGIMLRHPQGLYKFGQATAKQQWLFKFKRFEDAEAEIIGVEELTHNENEATINALGLQERSGHKAGRTAANTLGALLVRGINGQFEGIEFKIGSGFDQADRDRLWADRNNLVGRIVTYKYQNFGVKDAPRLPIFKAFRED